MRRVSALIFCLILASPLIALAVRAFPLNFDGVNATLGYSLLDTALLIIGTLIVTTLIAVPLAALLAFTNIPFKFPLFVACCLPLALPPYLTAFTWVEMADGLGFIQTVFRHVTGYKLRRDYWFPEIRSLGGAIYILSLALYPYVFLTLYTAFKTQGSQLINAALTLGATPKQAFRRIALKLIKPALLAGLIPVAFEALNDIAVAKVTGVHTLPLYIMNIWLEKNNIAFAALLSLITILIIAFIITRLASKTNNNNANNISAKPLFLLKKRFTFIILFFSFMPFLLGFTMPMAYLISLSGANPLSIEHFTLLATTFKLSLSVTLACVFLGLSFYLITKNIAFTRYINTLVTLGYAIPGSILGFALLTLFTLPTLALFGTFFALCIALALRFMTLIYSQILIASDKAKPLTLAARTLGATPFKALYAIEWAILKPYILISSVLIAIETVKELPLTLMLRPVGFETIALKLYEVSERSALNEIALPAILMVACCIFSVSHLIKKIYTSHV